MISPHDSPKTLRGKKIFYFRVHDADYPRNSRIRKYLQHQGAIVEVSLAPKRSGRDRLTMKDARHLLQGAGRADLLFVSEFQTKYVLAAWAVCKITRTRLVVDGFVGRFETYVGDWQHVGERSLKAKLYKIMDSVSVRFSDLFIIDTELRADLIRSRYRLGAGGPDRVLSLPVGSPAWAVPASTRQRKPGEQLRILYYGNYIPLHGVEHAIRGVKWAADADAVDLKVTMVGDGVHRAAIEQLVEMLGLGHAVHFVDAVPERSLHALIVEHDLVLGIFGTSEKAATVIANKVWQGLSSGRPVLTRDSPALEEIREAAGSALIEVPPGDDRAIGEAILRLQSSPARPPGGRNVASDLERLVTLKYQALGTLLGKLSIRRK